MRFTTSKQLNKHATLQFKSTYGPVAASDARPCHVVWAAAGEIRGVPTRAARAALMRSPVTTTALRYARRSVRHPGRTSSRTCRLRACTQLPGHMTNARARLLTRAQCPSANVWPLARRRLELRARQGTHGRIVRGVSIQRVHARAWRWWCIPRPRVCRSPGWQA